MKNRPILILCLAGTLSGSVGLAQVSDTSYRLNLRQDGRILDYLLDKGRGTPAFIQFKEQRAFPLSDSNEVFNRFFPIRSGIDIIRGLTTTSSYGILKTVKFQQYFKSIKVEHGSITLLAKNENLSVVTSEYYYLPADFPLHPTLTEPEAFQKAMAYVSAQEYDWTSDPSRIPHADLVIVEDQFAGKGMRLSFRFDIYAINPLSRAYVYVDALDGSILMTDRLLKHLNPDGTDRPANITARYPLTPFKKLFSNATGSADTRYSGTQSIITDFTGSNYRLFQSRNGDNISVKNYQTRNQSTTNNALAVEFTDADNNWTNAEYNNANYDNAALDVQFAMQFISDYWQTIHSRNSWDNAGGAMNSYVHVRDPGTTTSNMDNAFWLGGTNAMFYGDGTYLTGNTGGFLPLTSLDVSGHELGHAVCQTTANLAYQKESGAMNEGFSDIWGACIENFAGLGAPKNPWLIGEEIYPSAGYLRSMSDPKSAGQPDTYLGTYWVDVSASCVPSSGNDYCGVHTNSGVLNHWFYILTAGKSGINDIGNTYNVTGIGFTDAQKIAYATELLLTSSSTFANARTFSISASTTLFGACSAQTIAVTNAWYAVGIGAQFVPCGPEVYYKNALTTTSEFATPAGCPPSTKTINVTIRLENVATQQTDATLTVLGSGTTATNNVDYTIAPSTVSWNAGTTGDKTFTITLNDDHDIEGTEYLVLGYTLNNHGGSAIAGSFNQTHKIIINDDDLAPTDNILTTGVGTSVGYASSFGPFSGSNKNKRTQHLYTASDLTSAGFTKGNINKLGFYFYLNAATGTFNNFSLIIGNTSAVNLNSSFATFSGPTTTIYNGTLVTPTGTGWLYFNMPNPTFYWDGVSNLLLEACYSNSSFSTDVNLLFADRGTTNQRTRYIISNGVSVCGSAGGTPAQYQPLLYLQIGNAIQSAISLSNTSNLGPNDDVPFYSTADGKIMARIKNNSSWDYGCTQVVVDRAGTGTVQFWNATTGNYLTSKTLRVLPTNNNPNGNYTITLYYTKAEHDGWEAATGKDWESVSRMVKVSGHDISEVTPSTTSYFSNVTIALAPTRALFGTDYQVTATFTNGFSGFAIGDPGSNPLPVTLLSFTGSRVNDKSLLKWTTSFEHNNDHFDIETSKDGVSYYRIGMVPGQLNSFTDHDYEFTDPLPAEGANYYRLKQVDIDGRYSYSNIVLIRFKDLNLRSLILYPVPAGNLLTVSFRSPVTDLILNVYGVDGRKLITEQIRNITRNHDIRIGQLSPGTYLLETIINGKKSITPFVKQ